MSKALMGKIFLLVCGSVFLVLFLAVIGQTVLFIKKASKTRGRVLKMIPSGKEIGKYTPVVEFQVPGGEKIRFSPHSGYDEDAYREGDEISVWYDPDFPEDARIMNFTEMKLAPVVLFLATALLLAIGIFMPSGTPEPVPEKTVLELLNNDRIQYYLLYFIMPGGFALFGLILAGMGVYSLAKTLDSCQWPAVKGVIRSSALHESQKFYSPELKYEFMLNGKKMSGNGYRIEKLESGDPIPSRKAVQRYPIGKEVSVYYNPKNPEENVLEPGFQGVPLEVLLLFISSAGFFYFAWMAAVVVRYGWISE